MDQDQPWIECGCCSNQCRRPPASGRAYACPRCGERLRPGPADGGSVPFLRPLRRLIRLRFALTLATAAVATGLLIRVGAPGDRAAASAPETIRPRSLPIRLTEKEQRLYTYRLHQLERDLRRDAKDFEVLRRLGQLNLALAEYQVEDSAACLRRARFYLERARPLVMSRWEAAQIQDLMEQANAPNPSGELSEIPPDAGPPAPLDPDWVRWRIGYLSEQLRSQPHNSRLLRRLAESWMALCVVLDQLGQAERPHSQPSGEAVEAVRLAEEYYGRARADARTDESRCRALYGEAELYRSVGEPSRAAATMEKCLAIQPNNWLIAMRAAELYRQMRQPAEAERLEALMARWRTPAWL